MWDRYTQRVAEVIAQASREAEGQDRVAPEHLLLGLMHDEDNVASRLAGHLRVPPDAIRAAVRREYEPPPVRQTGEPRLSKEARAILTAVYDEAGLLNNNYIGTEHLLLALAGDAELAGRSCGTGASPKSRCARPCESFSSAPCDRGAAGGGRAASGLQGAAPDAMLAVGCLGRWCLCRMSPVS